MMNARSEKPDDMSPDETPTSRPRYLRVAIRLTARTEEVVSVIVVQGRPAQPLATGHPYVAVAEIGGEVVHVARYQDPFVQRSTRTSDGGDHHYSVSTEGQVEVSVPFGSPTDLARIRIRLADMHDLGPATAGEIVSNLEERRAKEHRVRELRFAQIQAAPNWVDAARALGLPR
jgi:hypothetical protein